MFCEARIIIGIKENSYTEEGKLEEIRGCQSAN